MVNHFARLRRRTTRWRPIPRVEPCASPLESLRQVAQLSFHSTQVGFLEPNAWSESSSWGTGVLGSSAVCFAAGALRVNKKTEMQAPTALALGARDQIISRVSLRRPRMAILWSPAQSTRFSLLGPSVAGRRSSPAKFQISPSNSSSGKFKSLAMSFLVVRSAHNCERIFYLQRYLQTLLPQEPACPNLLLRPG